MVIEPMAHQRKPLHWQCYESYEVPVATPFESMGTIDSIDRTIERN